MKDEKLKPCPLCQGEARDKRGTCEDFGDAPICCAGNCCIWAGVDAWQALPRASESVLEVAREMRGLIESYVGRHERRHFYDLLERLESAAPGTGTPGSVWVVRLPRHDRPMSVHDFMANRAHSPALFTTEAGAQSAIEQRKEIELKEGMFGGSGWQIEKVPIIGAPSKGECRDGIDTEHCGLVKVQAERVMEAERDAKLKNERLDKARMRIDTIGVQLKTALEGERKARTQRDANHTLYQGMVKRCEEIVGERDEFEQRLNRANAATDTAQHAAKGKAEMVSTLREQLEQKTQAVKNREQIAVDLAERVRELEGMLVDAEGDIERQRGIAEEFAPRAAKAEMHAFAPKPPTTADEMPVCPKCGKCHHTVGTFGNGYLFSCDCSGRIHKGRESWLRYCAENTKCVKCEILPVVDIRHGMGCLECLPFRYLTPAEWYDNNKESGDAEADRKATSSTGMGRDSPPVSSDRGSVGGGTGDQPATKGTDLGCDKGVTRDRRDDQGDHGEVAPTPRTTADEVVDVIEEVLTCPYCEGTGERVVVAAIVKTTTEWLDNNPREEKTMDGNYMNEARAQAAQCWCDEETSGIEMDTNLAEAFARRLAKLMETNAELKRQLATPRQRDCELALKMKEMAIALDAYAEEYGE